MSQYQQTTATVSHSLVITSETERPSTVMTDDCYDRIQTRVRTELGNQSPSAWIGACFTFIGVAATSAAGRLVIPKDATGLPAGARTILWVITVAAGIVALVCYLGHRSKRSNIKTIADNICDEMDTYSYRPTRVPKAENQ